MRLFIAEKPSVARAIAGELGIVEKRKSSIECYQNTIVTWCFGHLLGQAEPDEYLPDDVPKTKKGTKVWREEDLPIIPRKWILVRRGDPGAATQLRAIQSLLNRADEVVNAGDPDREGQLLVDEVLEFFGYEGRVLRFVSSALDPASIKAGLNDLKPNEGYVGMRNAALGRQRADWLIGMNLSRAYTLKAEREYGKTDDFKARHEASFSTVGRVQTPTLQLVYERDFAIENFKPTAFYTMQLELKDPISGMVFTAKWIPNKDELAGGKYFLDLAKGEALLSLLKEEKDAGAFVSTYEKRMRKVPAPLPYSLADLQREMSSKHRYRAEQTLDLVQSLYEKHRVASYPRTDSSYLPESQFSEAGDVVKAIVATDPQLKNIASLCDFSIQSRAWNSSKVTAHHAIIPTSASVNLGVMSPQERVVYEAVSGRYLAQFLPNNECEKTTIDLVFCGQNFRATGDVTKVLGWKAVLPSTDAEDRELPPLKVGDKLVVVSITGEKELTKPPSRYTEGTLITAMESIYNVYKDTAPDRVEGLKESDGIGTPATRAKIISELQNRGFMRADKGKLSVTDAGVRLLSRVHADLKSPRITAQFETALKEIEAGNISIDEFTTEVVRFVVAEVDAAKS